MNPNYSHCDKCQDHTATYYLSNGQPMCQNCGHGKSPKQRPIRDAHQVEVGKERVS